MLHCSLLPAAPTFSYHWVFCLFLMGRQRQYGSFTTAFRAVVRYVRVKFARFNSLLIKIVNSVMQI